MTPHLLSQDIWNFLRLKRLFGAKFQFVFLLLIVVSQFASTASSFSSWKYEVSAEDGIFQQVVVNPANGDVFVAGGDVLYQLSRILQAKQVFRFGPVLKTEDVRNSNVENEKGILEVDPQGRFLLHCRSTSPGACFAFSTDNIYNFQNVVYNDTGNQSGASEHLVGVFTANALPSASPRLYIARSFDKTNGSNPAKIFQGIWNPASGTIYNSVTTQTVGFAKQASKTEFQSIFDVQYVYSFEHDGFVYFLTVQEDVFGYETRLVRLCKGDANFNSYTEVALSCEKKGGVNMVYNIPVAAYVAPIGDEFVNKFHLRPGDSALYVMFGRSSDKLDQIDKVHGYGLCVYTLQDIKHSFVTAQRDCYSGFGRLLTWIKQDEPKCEEDRDIVMRIDDSFCGNEKNAGIGSRYALQTETNITVQGHVPTALLVTVSHGKTIAIVGTADGHVLKYLIDGWNSRLYADIDLFDGRPVAQDMTFDLEKKHVYVLTGSKISTVPIQSCSIYSTCDACVTTSDPLRCGWCDDHCSTNDSCHTNSWSRSSCPPILESFHPGSGPVRGGTRLTIHGQNFGTKLGYTESINTVTVIVAGTMCAVEFRNSSCIVCQTGPSVGMRPQEKSVKVTVNDHSTLTKSYEISGSSSSGRLMYAYKNPAVFSFQPIAGPVSGGTHLTVHGRDLDIGSEHRVFVADQNCPITRITASQITCITSALVHDSELRLSSGLGTRGIVNVSIDNTMLGVDNMVFAYKDDPVVLNVFPHSSILSGGMQITIMGDNLDIVQRHQIFMQSADGIVFHENCTLLVEGRSMVCASPDVSVAAGPLDADQSFLVGLSFVMDGVRSVLNASSNLSDFAYKINPVIDKFGGVDHVQVFYLDENYLEIQGQHLNVVATSVDYRVLIGDNECHITQLTSGLLLCRPDKADVLVGVDSLKEVKVFVGRLVFHVGYILFSERHKFSFIMLTAAPIMGSTALVVIILLFYWLHRFWRRKCNLDFSASYPHQTINQFEVSVMPNDSRHDDLQNSYLLQERNGNAPVNSDSLTSDDSLGASDWGFLGDLGLLIDRERLVIQDVIGQGYFGCVHRGSLRSTDGKSEVEVAVKTLKNNQDSLVANVLAARKFYEEALRMRDFDHVHILRLIGITRDEDGLPLVVLPFMLHGDLLTYIRCEDNSPTVRELMEFGIQVAEGMAYLSSLKYVHRDLAARNCMLDENMQIKVADFGLARDVYERDYYSCNNRHTELPVKWMALESLEKGIYNSKTDVWSYGIVLWELVTRGVTPYPAVDNWDVVRFLKSGQRMSQPTYAPDDLYSLMLICWHPVPSVRPTFEELVVEIRSIIRSLECSQRTVELNSTFHYVNVSSDQSYLDPLCSRSTESRASTLECNNIRFTGFRDTAV